MARYVALLGSINVGGNRLKMADLVAALEKRGFANVATVIASGNVLFDHDRAADASLQDAIAKVVKDEFDIDTFAAVRTRAELAAAIDDNPFAADGDVKQVHTLFLGEALDRKAFEEFAKDYPGPERLACASREIFVDFRGGVADSKLAQAMKPLKLRSTGRNLNSMRRMLAKMDD